LSSYVGSYRNPADETIRRIVMRDGTLMYVRVPGTESALRPAGNGRFLMLGVPARAMVSFKEVPGSKAKRMEVVVDSGKPTLFAAFDPAVPGADELKEYAGTFYSEELDAKYVVAAGDSQLVVRIKRFDDLTLGPTIRDVFKYQDYRVFRFRRDGRKRVDGFTMTSGRARELFFYRTGDPPPRG
jgi:hypothetical protein